ncbi:MAG: MCE family protein [Gammaproteobacteria bacterium]|nr:MCE family protein [Gammaproteobacteria bacterium]
MNENSPQPMQPSVKKHSGISIIWLVPVITMVIGIWLVVKTVNEQGPVITVSFNTAEGVEAGKTKVKYKSVDIGVVQSVSFSDDLKTVLISVQVDKQSSGFLKRGTNFWVVRPRLSLRGASGLGTLVSGAYIEIEPGDGAVQSHFIGLEDPPVVKADEAGKEIVLQAEKLGSIDIGSPVYYRGIQAGEIQGYELGNDRRSVFIHAFIKSPFDELVKGNSRFWNVSGVDISMSSEGFNMRTESFQSMLLGGVAFDTPQNIEDSTENIEELVFTLHETFESIEEQTFAQKINFVMFFEGSVRGLNIGAPVEFKGIKVGRVVDVRLEFDPNDSTFRIPVLVEIEPERVISKGEAQSPYDTLKTLVDQGLRARLQTGSLLTGKLFVELDMHPDTRVRLVSGQDKIPELPTIPAELEQITNSIKGVLAKLDKVKLVEISDELHGTLQGLNKLTNNPDIGETVIELKESLVVFKATLKSLDTENVNATLETGKQTLTSLQSTLSLMDNLLRTDSPMQFRFIQMADEMAEAARALQGFLELLEENPQSLIFGKGNEQ